MNSVEIGTATNYSDLLDKLVTFAVGTTWWTQLQHDASMTVLQGSGAGTDEIIVAFRKYSDVPSDTYGWDINGYTGYTGGLGFLSQPGAIPASPVASAYPRMPLWNSSIPYWFIVNSRRIVVVAKVSTVFMMAYAGFILPYATPGQWPYPLFVGGTTWEGSASTKRFSSATNDDYAFWRDEDNSSGSGMSLKQSSFKLRHPGGQWRSTGTAFVSPFSAVLIQSTGMYPYNLAVMSGANFAGLHVKNLANNLDGSYTLIPIHYRESVSGTGNLDSGLMGELDGIYYVSGQSNAPENVITVGLTNYLVVPNIFRTAIDHFCAVVLG